ncbi:MAG: cell wall-active antibiotics response protein LiaF [Paenibacillaceae bacterium]
MDNRNRNTAIMLIIVGVFFFLGNFIGFLTVSALILIWLGLYKIRNDGDSKGYVVLAIGAMFLLGNHLMIVIALILISLGYFLIRSKKVHSDGSYVQNQTLIESIKWDREPWVLKSMSRWSIIGEVRMDLSLALQDEAESIVMLQGLIGDIDIIVPEDYGISLEANVLVGRIGIGEEKDSGMLNKRIWRSANYETSEHKLKLIVSYAVADIEVKTL